MGSPKVTVLMSVYNGEKYLEEAIESILNQTYRDFEFIIINDGSTDGTSDILARYQQMDDRICIYNQENQGLIASLNRGCQLARGEYIARMDADDISLPERFARQVDYMEAHPEIGVLGTWIQYIGENGQIIGNECLPTAPGIIGWHLIFGNCVAHSSVMMRRDIAERVGFYHSDALHAEDYDLWNRASAITDIANLPEILVQHRLSDTSISFRHCETQEETVIKVMCSRITRLLGSETHPDLVVSIRRATTGPPLEDLLQIKSVASLLRDIYHTYKKSNYLEHIEAREVAHDAGRRFYTLAIMTRKISKRECLPILIQALILNLGLLSILSRQIAIKCMRTIAARARLA